MTIRNVNLAIMTHTDFDDTHQSIDTIVAEGYIATIVRDVRVDKIEKHVMQYVSRHNLERDDVMYIVTENT